MPSAPQGAHWLTQMPEAIRTWYGVGHLDAMMRSAAQGLAGLRQQGQIQSPGLVAPHQPGETQQPGPMPQSHGLVAPHFASGGLLDAPPTITLGAPNITPTDFLEHAQGLAAPYSPGYGRDGALGDTGTPGAPGTASGDTATPGMGLSGLHDVLGHLGGLPGVLGPAATVGSILTDPAVLDQFDPTTRAVEGQLDLGHAASQLGGLLGTAAFGPFGGLAGSVLGSALGEIGPATANNAMAEQNGLPGIGLGGFLGSVANDVTGGMIGSSQRDQMGHQVGADELAADDGRANGTGRGTNSGNLSNDAVPGGHIDNQSATPPDAAAARAGLDHVDVSPIDGGTPGAAGTAGTSGTAGTTDTSGGTGASGTGGTGTGGTSGGTDADGNGGDGGGDAHMAQGGLVAALPARPSLVVSRNPWLYPQSDHERAAVRARLLHDPHFRAAFEAHHAARQQRR